MTTPTLTLLSYALRATFRSRWIIFYTGFFLLSTVLLLRFGGDASKVMVSLLNIVLLMIPLVSILFGTTYIYNSRDFIELLLSQPIQRRSLFLGLYGGFALPLAAAFTIGVGVPVLLHTVNYPGNNAGVPALLAGGTLLSLIFTAFAFFIALKTDDKTFGLGFALLVWLFFAVLYDGGILFIIWMFRDYPLEMPVLAMSIINPIDLARILVMLSVDIAALMGYTGAIFEKFFGSALGLTTALLTLILWIIVPLGLGLRIFQRKNL